MTVCSIQIDDSGAVGFFRPRHPNADSVPGLLGSQRLTAAGFSGKAYPGAPQLGRNGFLAFWESDAALDDYLASDHAQPWADAWQVRCEVTRAIGRWPGLPADISREVRNDEDHPVIGISLGPLRLSRGFQFNRLNTRIEAQLLEADGLIWASAFFAPPTTLSTATFWESAAALHSFARSGAHETGMKASLEPGFDPSLPSGTRFFKPDLVFMSLRPYATKGELHGRNPIPTDVFSLPASDAAVEPTG